MSDDANPQRPTPSLDRLRVRVRERVASTSLKRVARAVGMSPAALDRFLNRSGSILGRSRAKLFHWVNRIESEADEAAVACGKLIEALVPDLPPDAQIIAAQAVQRRRVQRVTTVSPTT